MKNVWRSQRPSKWNDRVYENYGRS